MNFKIGDKIRCSCNDGNGENCPRGVITSIESTRYFVKDIAYEEKYGLASAEVYIRFQDAVKISPLEELL